MFRSEQHISRLLQSCRVDPVYEWMVLCHHFRKHFISTSTVHLNPLCSLWSSSKHANSLMGVLVLNCTGLMPTLWGKSTT